MATERSNRIAPLPTSTANASSSSKRVKERGSHSGSLVGAKGSLLNFFTPCESLENEKKNTSKEKKKRAKVKVKVRRLSEEGGGGGGGERGGQSDVALLQPSRSKIVLAKATVILLEEVRHTS